MAKVKRELPRIPKDPDVVSIHAKPGNDPEAAIAQASLRPTVQAGSTVRAYSKGKNGSGPTINALIAELQTQVSAVTDGDLRRAEALLIAQAHALDAIFGNLARRAVVQEGLRQFEAHLQLALKAQSQCRATLQALVEVKYPRQTQFVRQQNVAVNQQVNNGQPVSRTQESENLQNKLLEAHHGERLDASTANATGDPNPLLAAMGEINGTANGTG